MTRHLLLTLFVFALAIATRPDEVAAQRFSGSIRVGLAAATFTGESDTKFDYRVALSGGAGFTYHLRSNVGIRSELLYVLRGAKTDQAVLDGIERDFGARFSVAYVEVPVVGIFQPLPDAAVRPYFFGGGSIGRNVDARLTLISPVNGETVDDSDDSIRKIDHSLVGGVGLGFDFSGQRFFVEGRFSKGLLNVRPERSDAPLRNTTWLIMTGIEF